MKKNAVNKIYKIRRTTDGLYSSGGSWPKFTSKGKVWTSLGALKNHLNLLERKGSKHYVNCEIIPVEVVYTEENAIPMMDFIMERQRIENEKQQKRQDLSRQEKEDRERAELARLKGIYEGAP